MFETRDKIDPTDLDLRDMVVSINRVTKVVKGGKNLSFSALVVVGDGLGTVGFAVGKAKEVPSAIKKGIQAAKKADPSTATGDDYSTYYSWPLWRGSGSVKAGSGRYRHYCRWRRSGGG